MGDAAHFSQLIADNTPEQERNRNGKIDFFAEVNVKTNPFIC
jgi:hypothetical protein